MCVVVFRTRIFIWISAQHAKVVFGFSLQFVLVFILKEKQPFLSCFLSKGRFCFCVCSSSRRPKLSYNNLLASKQNTTIMKTKDVQAFFSAAKEGIPLHSSAQESVKRPLTSLN